MTEEWANDPTGRHAERLRSNGAWTASVRDHGVVNQDPVPGLGGVPTVARGPSAPAAPDVPRVPMVASRVEAPPAASTAPPARPAAAARPSRSVGDVIGTGVSITARLIVTGIWGAAGVALAAGGQWGGVALVVAYLAYLWLLGGRWLIW
ncbi:MAG: hypothetical protein JWO77_2819 [Ilumatobacteraceae bacterium]|nr:hypothetical protein [Ilumatobacteraceae bacterium]